MDFKVTFQNGDASVTFIKKESGFSEESQQNLLLCLYNIFKIVGDFNFLLHYIQYVW